MDAICILKFTKGHSSVKSVGKDTGLVLCIPSDNALYFTKICQSVSKGFRVSYPDISQGGRKC